MITLTTITEKQNIYILGCGIDMTLIDSVSLYDDYHSLNITNGDKESNIETEGSFYIVSEKEFLDKKNYIRENFGSDQEYFILKNFSGDIRLKVLSNKGTDVLNESFDKDDLLKGQLTFPEGEYWFDVVLDISGEFEAKTFKNG